MSTAELPITEADVSVVAETTNVQMDRDKLAELLDYLTQLEDQHSIDKFELTSEQHFGAILLELCTKLAGPLRAAPDEYSRLFGQMLIGEAYEVINKAVEEGIVTSACLHRFREALEERANATAEG